MVFDLEHAKQFLATASLPPQIASVELGALWRER
ncbi:hypothetical protein PMI35_04811 [Pseudomonas sp. GM78]|nr:hypothetical protein PMI35_04811 [Pseudomonas sp. GM78]